MLIVFFFFFSHGDIRACNRRGEEIFDQRIRTDNVPVWGVVSRLIADHRAHFNSLMSVQVPARRAHETDWIKIGLSPSH